jgi:hypothetical protein
MIQKKKKLNAASIKFSPISLTGDYNSYKHREDVVFLLPPILVIDFDVHQSAPPAPVRLMRCSC